MLTKVHGARRQADVIYFLMEWKEFHAPLPTLAAHTILYKLDMSSLTLNLMIIGDFKKTLLTIL